MSRESIYSKAKHNHNVMHSDQTRTPRPGWNTLAGTMSIIENYPHIISHVHNISLYKNKVLYYTRTIIFITVAKILDNECILYMSHLRFPNFLIYSIEINMEKK